MREAIALATGVGQGTQVAVLYNNLGHTLWAFEGPMASLEILRTGIAFAGPRGLVGDVDSIIGTMLDRLVDGGELDEALEAAAGLGHRIENKSVLDVANVRRTQTRILVLRGQAAEVAGSPDWLESAAREAGMAGFFVTGLGSSALARAGLGEDDAAARLLAEIEATPGAREDPYYASYLPAFVRTALAIGNRGLAESLAQAVDPRFPYAEHALVAANAALTEARGDMQAAVEVYTDAADRWERFGVVPEQGFALLGQGRCLVGLARLTDAAPVLQQAREIFERLGADPALAETDALLQEATALSS
jgi:hypothetical protein